MCECSPKTVKICPQICHTGRLVSTIILRNFQHLYASTGNLYVFSLVALGDKQPISKHIPSVGAFSKKFLIAPSGETTDPIRESVEVQKLHGPPLSPFQVWWGWYVARRHRRWSVKYSWLSCCRITEFVSTETPLSSVLFKAIWHHCIEEGL